ncbi:uncharacterized protein TRIADDRAFT_59057 [Trichoplax adhaerens]|uniref:Ras-GAP domain-containing protein n=1 Tax=Trichoplax adhaerens TaxID=10228 RepID=B3S4E7_TRIAD|nr:hypothetical protein TRIADDRAFT_59057 [Trichoplax adhaerens]EDV22626.1 hypothetical protein TRIADDRAFT_59057 [Trichoplax adhaerens]|eukprot:XP_002115170.1 hypothetical protein TRIADDRAFT_59057 [Trichoplax adhaerens]
MAIIPQCNEWVQAIIDRFDKQLPYNVGKVNSQAKISAEQNRRCLLTVSRNELKRVISGLTTTLRNILLNSEIVKENPNSNIDLEDINESKSITLNTLEECFKVNQDSTLDRELIEALLQTLAQITARSRDSKPSSREAAGRIILQISNKYWTTVFKHVSSSIQWLSRGTDDHADTCGIELTQYLSLSITRIILLFKESRCFMSLKRTPQQVLSDSISKGVWNWLRNNPKEFSQLYRDRNPELADVSLVLFDKMEEYADSIKKKIVVWPLQTLLLALAPDAVIENTKLKASRKYKSLAGNKQLAEGAAIACADLCKIVNYLDADVKANIILAAAKIITDLKQMFLNPQKPFGRIIGSSTGSASTLEIQIISDVFLASFRTKSLSIQYIEQCLLPTAPTNLHLAIVRGLKAIVTENSMAWWPPASSLYVLASDLRIVFREALTRMLQTERRKQTFSKNKDKKQKIEESNRDRDLVLSLILLFDDDPALALNTLRHFHQLENVLYLDTANWTSTLWNFNSLVVLTLSGKLVERVLECDVLQLAMWLREILTFRGRLLGKYKDDRMIVKSSMFTVTLQKLETALLSCLWNSNIETVLTALSCLRYLHKEAEYQLSTLDDSNQLPLCFVNYQELASLADELITGRAAIQKRIGAILIKVEDHTEGNFQAWKEALKCWQKSTNHLLRQLKEESGLYDFLAMKRRSGSSYAPTQDDFNEWANVTGFLCSFGGIVVSNANQILLRSGNKQKERERDSLAYARKFIIALLNLLDCNNDQFGAQIRGTLKEIIGQNMSPLLHPILFEQIEELLSTFFPQNKQAIILESNTLFADQIISIIRGILNKGSDEQLYSYLRNINIETIMLYLIRYIRNLPMTAHTVPIKKRLCQLVQNVMKRKDALTFTQQIKFRNKLVSYLTEWVMNVSGSSSDVSSEIKGMLRDLDLACMQAIAVLLADLPLQPDETEPNTNDTKIKIYLKYFTLFMNLLNECSLLHQGSPRKQERLLSDYYLLLHDCTVAAMSNLLQANIDYGLTLSLGLGYHSDLQTRTIFTEILTKILREGTEFDTLAETASSDRFEKFINLFMTTLKDSKLPLVLALINGVSHSQLDELCQALIPLSEAKSELDTLLLNVFGREVTSSDDVNTLFRGNTVASKMMTFCCNTFGKEYLVSIIDKVLDYICSSDRVDHSYEVDPTRINGEENVETNSVNLINLAKNVLNIILSSAHMLPSQLKSACHCLYEVAESRFPQSGLSAVSNAIFLRFLNPAIVSPLSIGSKKREISLKSVRGLKLASKILQNCANQVLFAKEHHMLPFNDFLTNHFNAIKEFLLNISSEKGNKVGDKADLAFVNDSLIYSLYSIVFDNQEQITQYFAANRGSRCNKSRELLDQLSILLAQLGPPKKQFKQSYEIQRTQSTETESGSLFYEFMAKHKHYNEQEMEIIKDANFFYLEGKSRKKYPVFYYICNNLCCEQMNEELVIYYIMSSLAPYMNKPWELVIDCTKFGPPNQLKGNFISKWFHVFPNQATDNLQAVYIYNCNKWVRNYVKYHERVFQRVKGNEKIIVIDELTKIYEYIEENELKLPSATTSLQKDNKLFSNIAQKVRVPSLYLPSLAFLIGPSSLQIRSAEKVKLLGFATTLNDVFLASEIEEISLRNENTFTLKCTNYGLNMAFISGEAEQIVNAISLIKHRWQLSQPNSINVYKKITPNEVPGTLLNMALLNLGNNDSKLRSSAYNLLCALATAFNLPLEGQLLETRGLRIPANNLIFIVSISQHLAKCEPFLTLQFLEESIDSFAKSKIELKHLCLQYMSPWLPNLARFITTGITERQKVIVIIEKLIDLTIKEKEMNSSVQAAIWEKMGQVRELIDLVLDCFIQASGQRGLDSPNAEVMANATVALAAANLEIVSNKIIERISQSLCTCRNLTLTDETLELLRHRLEELSSARHCHLFGISLRSEERMSLNALESITDLLVEVMNACNRDLPNLSWLDTWITLASKFVVYHKSYSWTRRDLLGLFIFRKLELETTPAIILARNFSTTGESSLYASGLGLLEESIYALDSQEIFTNQVLHIPVLKMRLPILEECGRFDNFTKCNFESNFHFAMVAILLKGRHHPSPETCAQSIRLLDTLLHLINRSKECGKYDVNEESTAYLAALYPLVDEIPQKLARKSLDASSTSLFSADNSGGFLWNKLLDPSLSEKTKVLLLCTLGIHFHYIHDEPKLRILSEIIEEASRVMPLSFPILGHIIDQKVGSILAHNRDLYILGYVQSIVQFMLTTKADYRNIISSDYLQEIGFDGYFKFAGPFDQDEDIDRQTNWFHLFTKLCQAFLRTYEGVYKGMIPGVNFESRRGDRRATQKSGTSNPAFVTVFIEYPSHGQ